MKTRTLGTTGIQLPPLCLGTMSFSEDAEKARAWSVDYPASKAIVKAALEAGLYFFDTAPVYSDGSSEKALGRALKELGVKREDVLIATKFYPRSQEEIDAGVTMNQHIRAWVEGSLKRLQTEYIDLLYMHMWDWNTPIEETLQVLSDLIDEGKIRASGLSNVFAWQAAMSCEKAAALHLHPISAIENQWNLISRNDETELVPCAEHYNLTLIPYASLAGGRLARPLGTVTRRSQTDLYGAKKFSTQKEADSKIIRELEAIAGELNVSMSSVALAWLMEQGAVPLAGATSAGQIAGLKEACDVRLSPEQKARLEEDYVPHVITGVLAEHTPQQHCYQAYNIRSMKEILPSLETLKTFAK